MCKKVGVPVGEEEDDRTSKLRPPKILHLSIEREYMLVENKHLNGYDQKEEIRTPLELNAYRIRRVNSTILRRFGKEIVCMSTVEQ